MFNAIFGTESEMSSDCEACDDQTEVVAKSLNDDQSGVTAKTLKNLEIKFHDVKLFRQEQLGRGAYGMVCKAKCDELPCAAKLLHDIFFTSQDSAGSDNLLHRFQQECEVLKAIRHPCIVQFLGTYQDPETGAQALLMELMDESLTAFLGRSKGPIAYHLQVSIAHDVALGLSYLHSNEIVHRDLSSNNVLLIAGSRAKVTDLGMAKLIDVAAQRVTPLTECPGTLVYMSPESLRIPPVYTKNLDIFSLGVLIIQIITREFPNPADAKKTIEVSDPENPSGAIEVPVPERERRQNDIDKVDPNHPLLWIIFNCLQDREILRPSAYEICHHLSEMKRTPQFLESEQQTKERISSVNRLEESLEAKQRELEELQSRVEEQASRIQALEREKENVARVKEIEIMRLRHILDRAHSSREPLESSLEDGARASSPIPIAPPTPDQWYHGLIDRVTACRRLERVGAPGAYLIRKSGTERGLVLSFLDREYRMHHFKIDHHEDRYNIGGQMWFDTLVELIDYHTKYSSVLDRHSERLEVPVPPPEAVTFP